MMQVKLLDIVSKTVNGGVFIKNIQPVDPNENVSSKVYSQGNENLDLVSFKTTTNNLKVNLIALMGDTHFYPIVKFGEQIINNFVRSPLGGALFETEVIIDTLGEETLLFEHEDGASTELTVTYEVAPNITTLEFTGDYPGIQTELKYGDKFNLHVIADAPFKKIYVYNYEAGKAELITLDNDYTEKTVEITIGSIETTANNYHCKIKVITDGGTESDDATTSNTVVCNDLRPTVSITTIEYNGGTVQQALKNSEIAKITNTVLNYDTVEYHTIGTDLTLIDAADTLKSPFEVQRANGDYNISTNNFGITAHRIANDSTTTTNKIVNIANVAPLIYMNNNNPHNAFRSGGNDGTTQQDYIITLVSNQKLLNAPSIGALPSGTIKNSFSSSDNINWNLTITIHDNDKKSVKTGNDTYSTFDYVNLNAQNLAGIITSTFTGNKSYILRGFVSRNLTVESQTDHTTMDVLVTDYEKTVINWTGGSLLYRKDIGDTSRPQSESWSIDKIMVDDNSSTPTTINILDSAAVNANSSPTILTMEETL